MQAFDTPLIRRLAALAILIALLGLGTELFSGPIASFTGRAALIHQQEVVISALKSRLAAARSVANRGAVIFADTREAAAQSLTGYITKATPLSGLEVSDLQTMPARDAAPSLVELRISAKATAAGLRMFLGALEAGGTAVAVPTFEMSPEAPVSAADPPTATIFTVRLVVAGIYAKGAGS